VTTKDDSDFILTTIHRDYVPSWGFLEAFRELQANAYDADDDAITIYDPQLRTLTITSIGPTLEKASILMGRTEKSAHSDSIGCHGEGLKLAWLALLRTEHPIRIHSNRSMWIPELTEYLREPVLGIQITPISIAFAGVRVVISEVDPSEWAACQRLFRRLSSTAHEEIQTSVGTIILNGKGRIYAKGVLVEELLPYTHSYDLNDLTLDRDRRAACRYELIPRIARAWFDACAKNPCALELCTEMLLNDSSELQISMWISVPQAISTALAAKFHAMFGSDAIPVCSMNESIDAAAFGLHAVVLGESAVHALRDHCQSLAAAKRKLTQTIGRAYSWSDLTESEQATITEALALIRTVRPQWDQSKIEVVEFKSALLGLYSDGRVKVARSELRGVPTLLMVLVHEFSHACGPDNDSRHTHSIEEAWRDLWAQERITE